MTYEAAVPAMKPRVSGEEARGEGFENLMRQNMFSATVARQATVFDKLDNIGGSLVRLANKVVYGIENYIDDIEYHIRAEGLSKYEFVNFITNPDNPNYYPGIHRLEEMEWSDAHILSEQDMAIFRKQFEPSASAVPAKQTAPSLQPRRPILQPAIHRSEDPVAR